MSVTSSGITGSLGWSLSRSNTGFGGVSQGDSVSAAVNLDPTVYNSVFAAEYTLAAINANNTHIQSIDLKNFVDLAFETHTTTDKVIGIMVSVTGASITIAPGASNGLVWFWTGTSPIVTIKAGGFLVFSDGAATTVDATHKTLTLTNLSASVVATVRIAILCGQ